MSASGRWSVVSGVGIAHVIPTDDLTGHDLTDTCVCGPTSELEPTSAGDGWVVIHHSLDGREADE